jgi:hypothetical protein
LSRSTPHAFEGGPMYLVPRFEAGAGPLAWLNPLQAVAKGFARDGRVTFDVLSLE